MLLVGIVIIIGMSFITRNIRSEAGLSESGVSLTYSYEQMDEGAYTYKVEAMLPEPSMNSEVNTVGIRVMNSQVELANAQVWYEADATTRYYNNENEAYSLVTDSGKESLEEEHVRIELPIERLEKTSVGNWQGIEGHVLMPKNIYNTQQSITYKNIHIVLSCDGQVLSPSEPSYFNIETYYQGGFHRTTHYDELYYDLQ